jgi:hypothetical protein
MAGLPTFEKQMDLAHLLNKRSGDLLVQADEEKDPIKKDRIFIKFYANQMAVKAALGEDPRDLFENLMGTLVDYDFHHRAQARGWL